MTQRFLPDPVDGPSDAFDCIDCGCAVVRFGTLLPDQPKRCAGCQSLTWVADTGARKALRGYMLGQGIIGPVQEKEHDG